jgi:hypothetical protein
MKRVLGVVILLTSVWRGFAQGTVQFTCLLEGVEQISASTAIAVTGSGSLTLNGSLLTYSIQVPNLLVFPSGAHFHADGTDLIWSLAHYEYVPAAGSWPGGVTFNGSGTIPAYQQELLTGHWYVQLHSLQYVGGVIRGYVVPVPEPTAPVVFAAALAMLWCRRVRAAKWE